MTIKKLREDYEVTLQPDQKTRWGFGYANHITHFAWLAILTEAELGEPEMLQLPVKQMGSDK